jgi:ribosome-associated protein
MDGDLEIRPGLVIPSDELEASASRASGPGGQAVNTTSSRVTLRWNPARSNISEHWRSRILERLAPRLTKDGDLVIHAEEHRSQLMNREAARARLRATVLAAVYVPKHRVATKPSRGAVTRRLDAKKAQGAKKRVRSGHDDD